MITPMSAWISVPFAIVGIAKVSGSRSAILPSQLDTTESGTEPLLL
jgi:hypothetical protein